MLCDFTTGQAPPRVRYGLPRPQGNGPGTPCTLYGDDAARTPLRFCDEIDGVSSMPPLWPNTTPPSGKSPAGADPICPEERISGAATLEPPSTTPSPPPIGGSCLFPGVNHLTIRYDRVLKEGLKRISGISPRVSPWPPTGRRPPFCAAWTTSSKPSASGTPAIWTRSGRKKPAVYRALQRVPFAPARNFLEAVAGALVHFRLCPPVRQLAGHRTDRLAAGRLPAKGIWPPAS